MSSRITPRQRHTIKNNLEVTSSNLYEALEALIIPGGKAARTIHRREDYRKADEYYKNKMRFKKS